MRLTDLEMDVLRSERGRERGEREGKGEGESMEYMVISVKHLYCKR